jgi:hypothetical protein
MLTEKILHKTICKYIKLQYPKVIFTSDASGIRVSIGEAVRLKKLRSSNGIPDIIIFKPSEYYHGLFLEVKTKRPYKKDGDLFSNEHLQEQSNMINRLMGLGYYAKFVWSFNQATKIIDDYMNNYN